MTLQRTQGEPEKIYKIMVCAPRGLSLKKATG
jgi:hypothetical protein